jgi:hypothetical protein
MICKIISINRFYDSVAKRNNQNGTEDSVVIEFHDTNVGEREKERRREGEKERRREREMFWDEIWIKEKEEVNLRYYPIREINLHLCFIIHF